jgi:hypothetical protein
MVFRHPKDINFVTWKLKMMSKRWHPYDVSIMCRVKYRLPIDIVTAVFVATLEFIMSLACTILAHFKLYKIMQIMDIYIFISRNCYYNIHWLLDLNTKTNHYMTYYFIITYIIGMTWKWYHFDIPSHRFGTYKYLYILSKHILKFSRFSFLRSHTTPRSNKYKFPFYFMSFLKYFKVC